MIPQPLFWLPLLCYLVLASSKARPGPRKNEMSIAIASSKIDGLKNRNDQEIGFKQLHSTIIYKDLDTIIVLSLAQ